MARQKIEATVDVSPRWRTVAVPVIGFGVDLEFRDYVITVAWPDQPTAEITGWRHSTALERHFTYVSACEARKAWFAPELSIPPDGGEETTTLQIGIHQWGGALHPKDVVAWLGVLHYPTSDDTRLLTLAKDSHAH